MLREAASLNYSVGPTVYKQPWKLKEGLPISEAGEVLDTITVQALIGRYSTVCGMTGTAIAAGEQFRRFYDLAVSPIEPNTPCIRVDEKDRVYDTAANKQAAIIVFIKSVHEKGQPILVGTQNVAVDLKPSQLNWLQKGSLAMC